VGFAVWASGPWRDELDRAIGPVMAWVIPVLLAYIPGLVIGFMASTLVVSPYHGLELDPPLGPWPDGEWPPVTVVAAWNEEQAIEATLERLPRRLTPVISRWCWRTTTLATAPPSWPKRRRRDLALTTGGCLSRSRQVPRAQPGT
jgi:hypothetical protein